jgi:hypothetical protein
VNVTGTPSGSDRSPFYARNAQQIDIPNLKLTGSPQYGLFFRQTNGIHLGQIDLRLTRDAGIGIRVDSGPSAGSTTDFNHDLTVDYVYGTGMGSHIGGGRGIFSVSGCGGLVIEEIDIADTGSTSILLQNTYNTVIAAKTGTVSGGLVQLTNDTDNTNDSTYPPSKDVTLQNLTLTNGASVRQDWCNEFGSNGCGANNITGGNVSMCD